MPFVVNAVGGLIADHHDSLADARAVVDVVRGLSSMKGAQDLSALAGSVGVCIGHMRSGIYTLNLFAAAGMSARAVPLLHGPVLITGVDPDGKPIGLSKAQLEFLGSGPEPNWWARIVFQARVASPRY
jgi:hypothetical protein